MRVFITTYNRTDNGLVLRNNWAEEVGLEYNLKEYLSDYFDNLEELIIKLLL